MVRKHFRDLIYDTCDGVYEPAEDTFLMINNVTCGGDVLEIGTGTGLVAIFCAKSGFRTDAVDISEEALKCAAHNAEINKVKIRFLKSDLFSSVNGKYDTMIFNPPYLPVEDSIRGSQAWDGGPDGFRVTRRFLDQSTHYLNPGGNIFIILSDLTNISGLIDEFPMLSFAVVDKQVFEFESIFCYCIRMR